MLSTPRMLSSSTRLTRNVFYLKYNVSKPTPNLLDLKLARTLHSSPIALAIDGPVIKVNDKLFENIGRMFKKPYFSPAEFQDPPFPFHGKICVNRLMICLPCEHASDPESPIINVWFILNTGEPHTYLSEKVLQKLNIHYCNRFAPNIRLNDPTYVIDALYEDKYKDNTILGTRALERLKVSTVDIN